MGEQLNAAEVTDRGLLGDRAYALVDRETGKVASAKFPRKWPTLLAHRATYVEPPAGADGLPAVRITLPAGRIIRSDDVLAAFVAAGGSVADAAARVGVRPSTAKRHLADLRARSGLTTEQLIYAGRAAGWLAVPSLEPS